MAIRYLEIKMPQVIYNNKSTEYLNYQLWYTEIIVRYLNSFFFLFCFVFEEKKAILLDLVAIEQYYVISGGGYLESNNSRLKLLYKYLR